MPNFYSTLRRFALTTLLGGGGLLSAQAQIGQTVAAATNAAGTYTDLGTTGTVISTTNQDDANSTAQNIGFTFGFNKLNFTQFVLNTNGVIRLGSAAPSTAALFIGGGTGTIDPLQSTNAADVNLILPFNVDLVAAAGGAEYRVLTTGTAGSQVCTIQWKNVADKAVTGSAQQFSNFSFQVKLYENGRVEFVYGTATAGTGALSVRDANVGLKGSGIGNTGQLLLAAKSGTDAWSAAAFRGNNYGATTFNYAKTPLPDAGRTLGFSDPSYCVAGTVTQYPYTQNFDGVTAPTLPCGVTVIDSNGDGKTWANYNSTTFAASGTNSMRYSYSASGVVGDDWFFTQALNMTVGKSYQLQFKYRGNGTLTEAMEVKVGNAATAAAQTTTVFTNNNFNSSTYITTAAGSAAGQVLLFTPTTAGTYYFGFHAISPGNQWYIHVDDVQVTEQNAPACPQPTALAVGNITTTTATVTFNGPTNGTAYNVIYVPKGTTPTASSPSVSATASPVTLSGLTSNTNYDVYVQATCGTSGSSATTGPVSFLTACAIVTSFPYIETFDGVTAPTLPCGVTTLNVNNDTGVWVNNSSSNGNTAPNAMRYNYSTTNTADDWFFTNGITMTVGQSYQLQFKYKAGSTIYTEGLEVKVGNAATVAAQTTTVFSNTAIQSTSYATTTAGSTPGQVTLFTPTTSGVYYFGFHAISIPDQLNLYVDDIQVTQQVAPACPQPTAVVVSGITTTGATVTFNGPTNGTAYSVVYVPRGTTPTASSPSISTTTSPVTLSGLTSNTAYDIYVQATCGTSGTSVSTGPVGLLTSCATTTVFPYIEKFDGVTAPALPCGITVLDSNADGKTWGNVAGTSNSTPNAMRYNYNSAANADDWFFTNAMNLQAGSSYQLEFKYRTSSTTYVQGLEVKAGQAATAAGQTTTVYSNNSINNATFATTTAGTGAGQVTVFTPTTSGLYYFGFHAISAGNFGYLYIDDVQVTLTSLAACPTPTNISVSSIIDTQAQVTFTGPSVGTSYQVIYVPRGTTPTASSPSVTGTTSPITVTGLTPNTPYDIYVQGTCGTAGLGLRGGPVSFTTACATFSNFPYSQNFDGVTAPALPCGITVLDANNDGSTWVNSNDNPSSGVNSMRYLPSPINNADDWFFLNALRLQTGMSYQLSFKYRVFSYNYPEKMEIKIGTGTTAATQTTTLFSNNNILNGAYVASASGTAAGQVASFTPPANGIYFIGFHALSTVNSFSIYIDDIQVTAATVTATKSSVAPGFSAEASPVPFSDHLNLSLNTLKAGPLQLTLHDAVGRVVRETTATVPAGASSLAVPNAGALPAGMYILTVRQGGNTQVIRVAHE